jgi:pseudo-rSAM protein
MVKYWVTLLPETFLWIKNNRGLVYQSANQKSFKFDSVGEIANICNHLLIAENLYTIELTETDIEKIGSWINSVMEINAGYLTQKNVNVKKPVSLKPIIKIQDNTKHYAWQHNRGIGGEIIRNLHELTFYINGSRHGDDDKYRQTVFPIKECDGLNINKILGFIDNAKSYFLSYINVVGNIFTYSGFDMLFAYMSESQKQFTINITLADFANNMQ